MNTSIRSGITKHGLTTEEENFLLESNRIEGIIGVRDNERKAFVDFMELGCVTIKDLQDYVKAVQPNAQLRDRKGLNVIVGNHYPPLGDITIRTRLEDILEDAHEVDELGRRTNSAYVIHQRYETLHPFTDGNGRSGRMLWWWMMGGSPLGFLHKWYYQSLEEGR